MIYDIRYSNIDKVYELGMMGYNQYYILSFLLHKINLDIILALNLDMILIIHLGHIRNH